MTGAENDPLVRAVMETFPGAKVTDVRPLGHSDGGQADGGHAEGGPVSNPNFDTDEVEQ